jgi:hypothetical protein
VLSCLPAVASGKPPRRDSRPRCARNTAEHVSRTFSRLCHLSSSFHTHLLSLDGSAPRLHRAVVRAARRRQVDICPQRCPAAQWGGRHHRRGQRGTAAGLCRATRCGARGARRGPRVTVPPHVCRSSLAAPRSRAQFSCASMTFSAASRVRRAEPRKAQPPATQAQRRTRRWRRGRKHEARSMISACLLARDTESTGLTLGT